jgi:1,4-dihydroxy-2-naphthoyl-CoA hydrolase
LPEDFTIVSRYVGFVRLFGGSALLKLVVVRDTCPVASDETTEGRTQGTAPPGGGIDATITGEFVTYLGVQFTEVSGDKVVATWDAVPKLHQPYGIVHGGVHCSLVETLASIGAATWLGETGKVVGVNNNTDFYRAVREGVLTSTATPLHRGRSQQVWLVETVDEQGRLAARGQVRLQNLY